jgi:sugar phosphate permease
MSGSAQVVAVGARRWAILGIAWLAFLMSFADRLAWGNVAADVGHSLGLPLVALGAFVTAFYVGYVLSNVLAGMASDWWGPRAMLTASLLCLGLATFVFGSIGSLTAGLALQAMMGLTAGADYAAGVKLIATWFGPTERGRAMGLFMTSTSIAVTVTNLLVPALMPVVGWSGAYRLLGAVTVLVGVAAWVVVRDAARPGTGFARPDYAALLRNRPLRLLGLAGFGALWGTWGFAFWASSLMRQGHGLSAAEAGYVVALFGAGAIVAKPLIGLVSDLLGGRRKALVIGCLVYFVLALLVFAQLGTLAAFKIMGPLLGVGAFAYSPLMNTMVAEAAGQSLAASGAGVTNAFWGLGNVIVPTLVGLVFQATRSFELAFVVLALGPAFSAACMVLVPERSADRPLERM